MGTEGFLEGTILEIEESDGERTGLIDFQGVRMRANLDLLPGVVVGQNVMVHRGVALSACIEDGNEVCR